MSESTYLNFSLGETKPTSVQTELVEVDISTDNLFTNYAKAFVSECYRVNPLKAEQVELTADEVQLYTNFLVDQRIKCVNDECTLFRKLKSLYIPAWIQYNLAMIGEVNIRDLGLKLVPTLSKDIEDLISFEDAIKISDKIGAFEEDLQIVRDAMPRSKQGDVDVMSTALIAGYVRSIRPVQHVSSTYVTAFMGMKLREEAAFKVLYRTQYDDAEFIAAALTAQRGLFK